MKGGQVIAIFLVIGLIILGFVLFGDKEEQGTLTNESSDEIGELEESPIEPAIPDEIEPSIHIVEIISSGFSPEILNINKGDTVTFANLGISTAWPASSIHPFHRSYPGSSLSKCNTDEKSKIFDACKQLNPKETYSFIFDEIGSWNYHNHINPSMKGTIIVS